MLLGMESQLDSAIMAHGHLLKYRRIFSLLEDEYDGSVSERHMPAVAAYRLQHPTGSAKRQKDLMSILSRYDSDCLRRLKAQECGRVLASDSITNEDTGTTGVTCYEPR